MRASVVLGLVFSIPGQEIGFGKRLRVVRRKATLNQSINYQYCLVIGIQLNQQLQYTPEESTAAAYWVESGIVTLSLTKMDIFCLFQPLAADGRRPGQVHFENLCMKAVNQSIGTMLTFDYFY